MGLDRNGARRSAFWQRLQAAGTEPEDYAAFVCRWDENFYDARVRKVGFIGGGQVLDAGCGFGQWTFALAHHNQRVVAVDQRLEMTRAVRKLCERSGIENIHVVQGALPNLGLSKNSFDFIWCSLVLEYVDRDATMRLFRDLLRPGGRLYVSTNARGRWLVKAIAGVLRNDWNLVRVSARTAFSRHASGAIPNRLDLVEVPTHVGAYGLRLLALGSEGYVHLGHGNATPMPMFPTHLLGFLEQNIEFVCEKTTA